MKAVSDVHSHHDKAKGKAFVVLRFVLRSLHFLARCDAQDTRLKVPHRGYKNCGVSASALCLLPLFLPYFVSRFTWIVSGCGGCISRRKNVPFLRPQTLLRVVLCCAVLCFVFVCTVRIPVFTGRGELALHSSKEGNDINLSSQVICLCMGGFSYFVAGPGVVSRYVCRC